MCLSEIWTDEQMEEWLAGQGEVIEVWKVSETAKGIHSNWYSGVPCQNYSGYTEAFIDKKIETTSGFSYWAGFHFYIYKKDAKQFLDFINQTKECFPQYRPVVIKCFVKKEWITAIGKDKNRFCLCVVASQAIFPRYPETEARMEDMQPFIQEPIKERV